MTRFALAVALVLGGHTLLGAQAAPTDTTPKISLGGFVDGYYAFDFNRPADFDRSFAFVEAKLDTPRVRGRFAIQTGTSVHSNYAGEPHIGGVSGPDLARFIQEAVVGTKLADNLWVDGGIFRSHIGMESFISRDSPMYTRSLVADYTPYCETGAKLTWQATQTIATARCASSTALDSRAASPRSSLCWHSSITECSSERLGRAARAGTAACSPAAFGRRRWPPWSGVSNDMTTRTG